MKLPNYYIESKSLRIPVYEVNTVIVGSGAAAFNCAHTLATLGQSDIAIVTEGIKMGTSRNTGSDKQTYYKVSTGAEKSDSAYEMAEDMFSCGSMHGDLALVEALGSLRSFFKLVTLGVPFPHSELGEYTGYKTDHDEKCRATSCGPLTSKYMTEALEKAVNNAGIPLHDGHRVISLINRNGVCGGVVTFNALSGGQLTVFSAMNTVYAVGGPSGIYASSVYPESQNCSLGTAFAAGASGVNLTESQYGIASLKFRWNLSGSYQQILPRYVSCDSDGGDQKEFLREYFDSDIDMMHAVFRKGYEWPFDPSKISAGSHSSIVDLAVFNERKAGRRVFLDFMNDPAIIASAGSVSSDIIGDEAYEYLSNCSSTMATPISRLRKMNEKAYRLYLDNGIDLEKEMLEIGVCAQHCNGGLEGDVNYESPTLSHFFPIGEANGVFGVKRPGGSALNSTQVSGTRAAEKIVASYSGTPGRVSPDDVRTAVDIYYLMKPGGMSRDQILAKRAELGRVMDNAGAFKRSKRSAEEALSIIKNELDSFFTAYSADSPMALHELAINYDTLITQAMMLSAIIEYIDHGGKSRGSYLITELSPAEITKAKNIEIDADHSALICRMSASLNRDFEATPEWINVRPIPHENCWFENVYNSFYKTK